MTEELFDIRSGDEAWSEPIGEGACLLHGFVVDDANAILDHLPGLTARAPFRQQLTPGGRRMSVAMSNCGQRGWVTDRKGYRYQSTDPESGLAWPPMPALFRELACSAAEAAGFPGFEPDVCLINRYEPGARLSLHQDRDEPDTGAPIVSFSLGVPGVFLWGGLRRADRTERYLLKHGDAVVWGGPDRLRYHGIAPLKEASHPLLGDQRINLTFRQTGLVG